MLAGLGHVKRMEDGRLPNKLMGENMYEVRKRRRPRKNWIQDVEKHLKAMNGKKWMIKAQSKDSWKLILI